MSDSLCDIYSHVNPCQLYITEEITLHFTSVGLLNVCIENKNKPLYIEFNAYNILKLFFHLIFTSLHSSVTYE